MTEPEYSNPLFSVAIGMIGIGAMIFVTIVIFLFQFVSFKRNKSTSGYLITFAILASLCFMFCAIFLSLHCYFIAGIYNNERLGHFYDLLQFGFWHFGQLFCYLYLLNRLYIGFKNTIYSLSTQMFIMLITLLFMYFIFSCMVLLGAFRQIIQNDYNGLDTIQFYSITITTTKIGTLVVDLIISTSLLVLFIKKLWNVSTGLREMSTVIDMDILSDDVDNTKIEIQNMDVQTDSIYNVMTKVTILSVILILASQLKMISSVISWLVKDYSNLSEFNIWVILAIYQWCKGIHIFTASLCIFMGFEFTNNWYQCCCNKCHNKTKQYCIRKINQKMTHYNTF